MKLRLAKDFLTNIDSKFLINDEKSNHRTKIFTNNIEQMDGADSLEHYKIVMLGDTGVGKTALVERLSDDIFANSHFPTVGAQFISFAMTIKGQKMIMELWDTAGQEVFRSLVGFYARDAAGTLLLFDLSHPESFESLDRWIEFIKENAPEAKIVLFANKNDLIKERAVTSDQVKGFAQIHNLPYFEGSAKTAENVQDAFETICEIVLQEHQPKTNSVDVQDDTPKVKKSCCK